MELDGLKRSLKLNMNQGLDGRERSSKPKMNQGLTFPLPLFSPFPYPFPHPYSNFFIPWVHLKKQPPPSSHWPNGKPALTSNYWPDRKLGSTSNYWNTKRRFGSP